MTFVNDANSVSVIDVEISSNLRIVPKEAREAPSILQCERFSETKVEMRVCGIVWDKFTPERFNSLTPTKVETSLIFEQSAREIFSIPFKSESCSLDIDVSSKESFFNLFGLWTREERKTKSTCLHLFKDNSSNPWNNPTDCPDHPINMKMNKDNFLKLEMERKNNGKIKEIKRKNFTFT